MSRIKKFPGIRGLGNASAKQSDDTLWSDLGMDESTSVRDRADTWRQWLTDKASDFAHGAVPVDTELLPVFPDIRYSMEPRIFKLIVSQRKLTDREVAEVERGEWDDIAIELQNQIDSASDGQIIEYGNAYYNQVDALPSTRGLAGTFDDSDVFDDVEDVEDVATPSPHDVVMNFLNAQKRGGTLKIGRQTFRVENAHGGTVYVTKSPGAGRKLYALKLVQFESVIEFIVDEVSGGSGKSLGNPPAARFTLNADGKLAGVGAQIARVSVYDDDGV